MLRRAFALSLALHGLGFAAMIALEGEPEPHARRPAAALAPAPPSVPVGAPQAHPVAVQRITILTAGKPSAPPSKLAAAPSRAPTRNVAPALAREPEGDAAPAEPTVRHTDGSVLGDAAYATWYRAVVDQIRALPDARAPGDGWWRVRLVMDAQGALLAVHAVQTPPGVDAAPLLAATLALGSVAAPPPAWVDDHVEVELRWRSPARP